MPVTVDVLGDLQFEKKTVCDSFNRQRKGRKLRIQQKISNLPAMKFEQLDEFRQLAYECLGNAKDATFFELADAVMTTRHVSCLGDFALDPLFRREWSSVYEALQDCSPDRSKLMQLYIQQMSQVERPVLAIDRTAWLRPHAPTLKERTYEHQPTALPHAIPVRIGQDYSTIAWIPSTSGSWALPLRHECITSWENPIAKGAQQWAASV